MHRRSILLVDDDPDDRELFRDAVKEVDKSVDCITCRNGEEMLALLSEQRDLVLDYIFLDTHMPVLNGKECFYEIRKINAFQSVPIVIYSAAEVTDDIRELINLGNVYFMTKPYSFMDLRKAIRDFLKKTGRK